MRDENSIAPDALQPRDDVLRIPDAAAEQEQLGLRRRERERQFVMHAAHRVGDHLVFVDHEQLRTLPPEKTGALRLERGDDDFRVQV